MKNFIKIRMPAHYTGLAKVEVLCSYENLVQGSSSVFQMNICAKNPRLRQAQKVVNNLTPKTIFLIYTNH